jgi:hypothetical protein
MQLSLPAERQAQLDDYASRHGQDPAVALDVVLSTALEWERQDYREATEGIRRGFADFKARRACPIEQSFEELREKHRLSR